MLSRPLHSQVFKNVSFPAPDPTFTHIAREHLEMHGLDPTQGSVLPDTSFTLPPLQGHTLDEHFHRIGAAAAEPWLGLSTTFASSQLPPRPEDWAIQSGWTKYYHSEDGSSFHEHVECLDGEDAVCFDVETMPNHHQYAVMATAATKDAWYAWISPWLLGESEDPRHLIPMGDPHTPRVVVGHNVSYDRARILEEYSLEGTKSRFVDTMALHIAVKGISSHQRPAWMKHRKHKEKTAQRHQEAVEAIESAIVQLRDAEERLGGSEDEEDGMRREDMRRMRMEMEESLPQLQADASAPAAIPSSKSTPAETEDDSKRWEDLTSVNSLADVAALHCGIVVQKELRSDFMTATPAHIFANIHSYLDYCASDVSVTHAVFSVVLPEFLARCPSPVSFAGILTMGSSFLTVNESWEAYLGDAERTFRDLEVRVKRRLLELGEQAMQLAEGEEWKKDPWLGQLDWTMKEVRKTRGVEVRAFLRR